MTENEPEIVTIDDDRPPQARVRQHKRLTDLVNGDELYSQDEDGRFILWRVTERGSETLTVTLRAKGAFFMDMEFMPINEETNVRPPRPRKEKKDA